QLRRAASQWAAHVHAARRRQHGTGRPWPPQWPDRSRPARARRCVRSDGLSVRGDDGVQPGDADGARLMQWRELFDPSDECRRCGAASAVSVRRAALLAAIVRWGYSNSELTLCSLAMRQIASPMRAATEISRTLALLCLRPVGSIELVTTSSFSMLSSTRLTAPFESTPWVQ